MTSLFAARLRALPDSSFGSLMDDRTPTFVGRLLPTGGASVPDPVGVVHFVDSFVVEPLPDRLAIFDVVFLPVPGLPLVYDEPDVFPTPESSLSLLFALARWRFIPDAVAMFDDDVARLEINVPLRLGVATSSLLVDTSFRDCPSDFLTVGFDVVFTPFAPPPATPAPSA